MECPRCNSRGRGGQTSKWQWVNSKLVSFRSGFRIHNIGLLTSRASKIYILNLASCLISHVFLPSFLLHNGHFSYFKLMISSSCLSLWSMRHDTDHCTALRHAIQDLIDQGLVNLGQPSVTTNPLPTHSTRAVHPSSGDIHHMDLIEDDRYTHVELG
ncbi:hypothetical protein AAG906_005839 [Vitis piasezkii]